ncbi:hypothetical protein [Aegicerativicinus sediminis]|uniref:hypothetical protein n=1 Tax=Aegicerativicinus sediminis TaxID=2893202 RepID=UPI001E3E27BB|nr:hypothetical protein [Aegicerativicinus sediminis]
MEQSSNNLQQNQEEVDLGQLFNAIGNFFYKVFQFIGKILFGLFLGLVWLVFFIKKHILIFVAVVVSGFVFGLIKENLGDPIYKSTVLIQQNYDTGKNLYGLIDFYNELIKNGDAEELSQQLGISEEQAEKIRGFDVSSTLNENDKLKLYDEYVQSIDSSTASHIDFKTFVRNSNDSDFKIQSIDFYFSEKGLSKPALNSIIKKIESIEYFKDLQKRDLGELEAEENSLKESLERSDSLQNVYKKVLIEQASNKSGSQTSVTIDNTSKDNGTKEYDLYLNDIELRKQLVEIQREKEDLSHIIEVVSSNQDASTLYYKKDLFGKSISLPIFYSIVFTLVAFVILLILAFLNFLERYKNKIE